VGREREDVMSGGRWIGGSEGGLKVIVDEVKGGYR